MESVNISWGSDSDFDCQIKKLNNDFKTILEITSHIDKKAPLISINDNKLDDSQEQPLEVNNLVMFTDDYGSINEWALLGFTNNILRSNKLNVKNVWLNNPPLSIYNDIKRTFSDDIIKEGKPDYEILNIEKLKAIADGYESQIIGQKNVIVKILQSIYSLKNANRKKPVAILFLGDSGVGKTETAKYINSFLKGEMVRIQFSMQQTNEAYNYIFGAKHGENCLARDLIRRKSNVILFDEFDKVHQSLFNAFYQMFDEGVFVDTNYSVNIEKSIIICTTNYKSEQEAENKLGSPIYSRFSKIIVFNPISIENKKIIAENNYNEIYSQLDDDDKNHIKDNHILKDFHSYISKGYYKNMRMLKNDIEDAINYEILVARKIIDS
ncbi:MAG: AAA family ATPase [Oscillospiraceae bacterium]|nr:AAA family ATPase [Oscillospiraceae bacterium]